VDRVDLIMKFESGELSEADTIELFQDLVDSGMAWKLQGFYGRTATALIEAGHVVRPTVQRGGETSERNRQPNQPHVPRTARCDRRGPNV